jgi:hypothetical protein
MPPNGTHTYRVRVYDSGGDLLVTKVASVTIS